MKKTIGFQIISKSGNAYPQRTSTHPLQSEFFTSLIQTTFLYRHNVSLSVEWKGSWQPRAEEEVSEETKIQNDAGIKPQNQFSLFINRQQTNLGSQYEILLWVVLQCSISKELCETQGGGSEDDKETDGHKEEHGGQGWWGELCSLSSEREDALRHVYKKLKTSHNP